jgi:O-antigen ligase
MIADRIALPGGHRWHVPAALALVAAGMGGAIALADFNALYLGVSLIGCAFILYDFRVGVVLLIVLMPVSGSALFPHEILGIKGLNPFNLLLAATFGAWLLHALGAGGWQRFVPAPLAALYIAPMLVAGALGARHVGEIVPAFYIYEMLHFDTAAGYLRDLLAKPLLMVLYALLVAAAVARSERPARFFAPILLSIWTMAAMAIVFVARHGAALEELAASTSRQFLSPLGMHANELGRLYAVAYAMLLFMWAESRHVALRALLLASMAMVVAALVLTFSRSAFVGLALVNLLFLLWRPSARRAVFFLLLAAAVLLLPEAVFERIGYGFDRGLDAVSAGRIEGLWLPLLPEVLRNPVFGSGIGSILWSETMHRGGGSTVLGTTHPHNAYLQALLDMGAVGLAALLAYFVHVWRGLRALYRDPALPPALRGFYEGAAAGLLGFLITAIADSSLLPKPEQSFLWLAIGMMYGQRHRRAQARRPG